MESKYYNRAEEILFKERGVSINVDGDCLEHNSIFIEAMCQLAEEVEKKVISDKILEPISKHKLFTKVQVDLLLQKQRKLCSEQTLTNREDILNAKLKID
jgi:hypothetical protein